MARPAKPLKRSAIHYRLMRAGAALADVSGWLVAEHFGDALKEARATRARVGISDQSYLPKYEVLGKDLPVALGSVLGGSLPQPGRTAAAPWGYACGLDREGALLVLGSTDAVLPAALSPGDACLHVVDRTHGYASFLLCGPFAPNVIRKLSPIDIREEKFPNLSCAATPVAAVRAVLVRRDRGGLRGYEVFFGREYGEYFWDAMMEAGAEFEMRPFGLAATRALA